MFPYRARELAARTMLRPRLQENLTAMGGGEAADSMPGASNRLACSSRRTLLHHAGGSEDAHQRTAGSAAGDATRQALDRAFPVDLLEFPEDVLHPLANLRQQWWHRTVGAWWQEHGAKRNSPAKEPT